MDRCTGVGTKATYSKVLEKYCRPACRLFPKSGQMVSFAQGRNSGTFAPQPQPFGATIGYIEEAGSSATR